MSEYKGGGRQVSYWFLCICRAGRARLYSRRMTFRPDAQNRNIIYLLSINGGGYIYIKFIPSPYIGIVFLDHSRDRDTIGEKQKLKPFGTYMWVWGCKSTYPSKVDWKIHMCTVVHNFHARNTPRDNLKQSNRWDNWSTFVLWLRNGCSRVSKIFPILPSTSTTQHHL